MLNGGSQLKRLVLWNGHNIILLYEDMTMSTFDFSPLYRSSVGFDHLASLLDSVSANDRVQPTYPPYNIEQVDDDQYRITLAVAGFLEDEITIESENNTLTVSAKKSEKEVEHKYLHRGIAARDFRRQFKLENHVEVVSATTENGLLHVNLVREIPEAMKPRRITINDAVENTSEKLLKSA